jgi:dimethylargininase
MKRAIVRGIPASFANALATVTPEHPIDVARARDHHEAYCAALGAMGVAVTALAPDAASPDCVFVEDTAVVADGLALITRPGAPSRRAETEAIAAALASWFELARMDAPATLDGGDCMRVGSTMYVGRSARTNAAGIARLAEVFSNLRVVPIDLPAAVLHLKCVCSPLGDDRILLAEGSLPAALFPGAHVILVPAAETYAANAVAIGCHVLVAAEYPRTHDTLAAAGFTLHPVPTAEVRKADGSLTCQSIVF